jgi:hypothetical protein
VKLTFSIVHDGWELAGSHIGLPNPLHESGFRLEHGAVMLVRIQDANCQI